MEYILPILIFLPLLMAAILFTPLFAKHEVRIRRFSKGFQTLHFLASILLLVFVQTPNGISYYKEITFFGSEWIQPMGLKFALGADGISIIMVILTSFITLLALIASKSNIRTKHKFYYALMFLLQTAVLGVFCARDMFLFFLFWELELVPMYFLIGQWGDGKAKKSAMKFVLYTFLGSLFMLLGILLLHFYNFAVSGVMTGDFSAIAVDSAQFPIQMQILISVLLLIGFAVKLPIVPFHTWLPDAHVDAPTPVSMLLAAVLLKMGAFGLIRFNIQLLPDAFVLIAPILVIFALINIIYTAFVAYHQTDLKKIIAYSSISNMGIVLLGLCALNLIGLSGAVFHMISHGIVSAGLFMIVGIIYLRTKTRDLTQLGGLGAVMPRLMGFSVLITLAAVGVPLLSGFIGEFMSIYGAFVSTLEFKVYALIALTVLILSACYMLKFLHKTFFGNLFERWENIKDMTNHELVILTAVTLAVVFFGIFPMAILDVVQPIITSILESVRF